MLCLRYPDLLNIGADARAYYPVGIVRLALHLVSIASFALSILSVVLRKEKALGLTALGIVLLATLLGGSAAQERFDIDTDLYFGFDWFLLNVIFTGLVFIPIERWLGKRDQPIFRFQWREDLFYFLVKYLFVQSLTYLTLMPALTILANTTWTGRTRRRSAVSPVGSSSSRSCFSRTLFSTGSIACSIGFRGYGNFMPCITRPKPWTGSPEPGCM